jgi:hypothetical protein
MRTFAVSVVLTATLVAAGCGATRRVATSVAPGPTLTAAMITFSDQDHGKDADSAADVWLLRNGNEMAHLHTVGTKFDDHATTAPMTLAVSGTFSRADVGDAQLRIRLTPDGADDWSFAPRLTLSFSDGTSRSYMWPTVQLDNRNPERTLSLSSAAQVP